MKSRLTVRDANAADLEGLKQVNYADRPVIHRDRLQDAGKYPIRYLVVEQDEVIVGFSLLVFERPPSWPNAGSQEHLPQVVDLYVRPDERSKGIGAFFITKMEEIVVEKGSDQLFIAVDPLDNPRAYAFYLRLGYTALEQEPQRVHWHFTDSDGNKHEGEGWNLNLVRHLAVS